MPLNIWTSASLIVVAAILWLLSIVLRIAAGGLRKTNRDADVALVLGAAVDEHGVSDVFRERLKHAIQLYHNKRVRALVFTGGVGAGKTISESMVAKQFAIKAGVPADKIFIEEMSNTTFQNLYYAREVMIENKLGSALIVTDPTHMMRAMMMCRYIGMDAHPSPRPVNANARGDAIRGRSIFREMLSYIGFVVGSVFILPEENPKRF